MKAANTLFIKVVPQTQNRGFMLLCGFQQEITHRTAEQFTSLCVITRDAIDSNVERLARSYSVESVVDVTAPGVQKKLEKIFIENEFAFA